MPQQRYFLVAAIMFSVVCGTISASLQDKKPKKVTRVKRPNFTERDWDGIYFENLFEQGLVGDRPKATQYPRTAKNDTSQATEIVASASTGFAWTKFIAGDVLENEIKSLAQSLQRDVTTPVKFKSEYGKVRQSFSILSLMFGIIREYETDDVRWKKHAPSAQAAFARAAGVARVGTQQAYQNAQRNTENLADMIRGGAFAGTDKAPEVLEWPRVVDRSPMMERLQISIDKLKPATANNTEFKKNVDMVYHEANIVAAIGQALIREDMDEADEEEYAVYARAMSTAAVELVTASTNNNFELATKSSNLIGQSCSNCHNDWR